MGVGTKIAWTENTLNTALGCRRISKGCERCYAEVQAARNVELLRGVVAKLNAAGDPYRKPSKADETLALYESVVKMDGAGNPRPLWNGRAVFDKRKLTEPYKWKEPRRVFVNSMSDVFHEDFTNEEIAATFGVFAANQRHVFQVLTKRPKRMLEWFKWIGSGDVNMPPALECHYQALQRDDDAGTIHSKGDDIDPNVWPLRNVWIGVSCENQETADERIPLLLQCPAAVRWISAEPLLGEIDLEQLAGRLDWCVVGGESGRDARPCHEDWIRKIVGQCAEAYTACFVKQMGADSRNSDGDRVKYKHSKGGDIDEFPADLRVREYPER